MRILFVDDDPDERALASRAVGHEFPDAKLAEAYDSESLASALNAGELDLLITDFDLRWIDGLEVFDKTRAAHPSCCAIMYTGTGNEELAVRAMKQGFNDYVVKGASQRRRLAASARVALTRRAEHRDLVESRALILQELYHRLHNNLQIVISLIRQTQREVQDPAARQRLAELADRIRALSTLQEHLYRSGDFRSVDFAGNLLQLAQGIVGLAAGRIRLETSLDAVDLPVDTAVPLTLIVNELLTNAIKHAFPDEREGQIEVRLERAGSGLSIVISDNGVGWDPATFVPAASLGRRIIERLADQVGAELSLVPSRAGTECRITLPL
jgi:two-component sensor histidine kinase